MNRYKFNLKEHIDQKYANKTANDRERIFHMAMVLRHSNLPIDDYLAVCDRISEKFALKMAEAIQDVHAELNAEVERWSSDEVTVN
jgi:hypothetical protein